LKNNSNTWPSLGFTSGRLAFEELAYKHAV
jgi:hypothetical protein